MSTLTLANKQYTNHWGRQLGTFPVPVLIFQNEMLSVPADALAVYLVLLHLYKSRSLTDKAMLASVRVGQEKLRERTGYTGNPCHSPKSKTVRNSTLAYDPLQLNRVFPRSSGG